MGLFARREKPPALDGIEKDERVLSWADTAGGSAVVATSRGLWWPVSSEYRLIAWHHIDKAVWRDGIMAITEAEVVDDLVVDRRPVSVVLDKPRDLPPVVRKRVEANIVRSELLSVGGGAVRFVARRVPGEDGVSWWARLEPGTPDTESVRAAISARLALLRAEAEVGR